MASTSSSGIVITAIPICILLLSSLLAVQTISGSWIPVATNILCLLLGAAATTVLKFMLFRIYKYLAPRSNHGHSPDIYGLDHGRLNITLPPQTMWMNMGYWKVCNSISLFKISTTNSVGSHHAIFADIVRQDASDFPAACEGLLLEILKTAKLLPPEIRRVSWNRQQAICVLDLGFGCGDQINLLLNLRTGDRGTSGLAKELSSAERLINRYVGITLNRSQFNYAKQRLSDSDALKDSQRVRIFCADAAKPSKWSAELHESVTRLKVGDHQPAPEIWVLALDTAYHFFPSRKPVLEYAYRELGASIMVFDLLVSDNASLGSRLLLAVLALLMGCPANTLMTEQRYRNMLHRAGYREDRIEFRDISEHIFAPMARFLNERNKGLRLLGLDIGGFVVAKWMFEWWAWSGVARGIIVVGRR